MLFWHVLLLAAALDLPAAEIETLGGDRHAGQLVALSGSEAALEKDGARVALALGDVLEIRFPAQAPPEPASGPRVALVDGSRLTVSQYSVARDEARLESAALGQFALPASRLAWVRFGVSTAALDTAWDELVARDSKDDLLVIRKEDVLDFLTGVAGEAGEKITFLVDGEEIPVAREKVYGIIYRRRDPPRRRPPCQVRLAGGDVLNASQASLEGATLKVRLVAGPEVSLAPASVGAIDYSAGKVFYLSQLEPREVDYVPFFDLVHEYRRNRSLDGTPLSIAGKTYAQGLAIHSKTTLRYRIGGEFSRFRAIAGIDDSVRRLEKYQARLAISGDGKALFEAELKGSDPPQPLDLDVSGVRDLEIVVDFGSDKLDIGDHVDLADAKLLK